MGKVKILTAREAADLLKDGDTLTLSGFVANGIAEALNAAAEKRFLEEGHPRDLTLLWVAGTGNKDGSHADHYAHEGMIKRVIGGHFNFVPQICEMLYANKIEGYNIPQGAISAMLRDSAGHKVGTFTPVGIGTFADPRFGGGRLSEKTQEDIVKIIEIEGEEQLFYPRVDIDVAFIRGTYADELGNITLEKEMAPLDCTAQAMAVHNNGGKVVVQVEKVVKAGQLDPKLVKIPGIYVDAVVVCPAESPYQSQSINCPYDPAYAGNTQVAVDSIQPKKLDAKKIIGRRAAMELRKNVVVNLGVGVPEWVSAVAAEEGVADEMTLTVECGPIGGVPGGGLRFGGSINAQAYVDEAYQFDFYDGGGLDLCYLGLAEVDPKGNVNVSRLGSRITGSGGFMNISSNSKKAVFCGTFTNGVKIKTGDGKLTILEEGKKHKFVDKVTEITFSGVVAGKKGKNILYVTERAVFALKADGVHLIEVAPGIDVEKQVLAEMDFAPIVDRDENGNVKLMDERIFKDEVMGISLES